MIDHDEERGLPPLTTDLEEAKAHLRDYGMALISSQLSASDLTQARDATYGAAEEDARLGREADRFGLDYGDKNVRVWNILNRDPIFQDMVQASEVMTLLEHLLGWPALLGNLSANIAEPGSEGGAWHQDQLFVPKPWPQAPQGMNFAWLLDDFTIDNGATEVIPSSHRWADHSEMAELDHHAMPVIAPAGTMMVFESRMFHRTGNNRSSTPRAALFGWYTKPIYRAQENWFLSLDQDVIERASETLLVLLGYKSQGLGLVYGRSPR